MTLTDLRDLTMAQLQEDVEDIADYQPVIDTYINQGYMLVMEKLGAAGTDDLTATDEPAFGPSQYHAILADYATYAVLSTGSSVRQSRGMLFYNRFLTLIGKCYLTDAENPENITYSGFKGKKITNRYMV